VRSDGSLGGYGLGVGRKRKLLEQEAAHKGD
jgi:O6-methylguanine-DNA--protein-cysteine methyltransferase